MNLSFLNQPKKIIAIASIIAIGIGVYAYHSVGKAPVVSIPATAVTPASTVTTSSDNQFNLAFPKSGRVAAVSVKVGDRVTRGSVLATLEDPSALGVLEQSKGALELAQAQYASQNVQYANAKKQQDVLVKNAYRTLLSSSLTAIPSVQDDSHVPIISGTYTCDREGTYTIATYSSNTSSGYAYRYDGLESGNGIVTFSIPQPLGTCGLYIQFVSGFSGATTWTVMIPNTKSAGYVQNKNAYDAAVATREQVLNQYEANLNATSAANTAKAQVDAAAGVYQTALGSYQNDLIVAPVDGTVTFIDSDLKVGQSIIQGKSVISITTK